MTSSILYPTQCPAQHSFSYPCHCSRQTGTGQMVRRLIFRNLADEILRDVYMPAGYREFTVNEFEKEQIIQSLNFKDRIALHAIPND